MPTVLKHPFNLTQPPPALPSAGPDAQSSTGEEGCDNLSDKEQHAAAGLNSSALYLSQ